MATYKLWPALPAILLAWAACAQAEGFQGRAGAGIFGDKGAAGRQGGIVADGNGNAAGARRRGFNTDKAQGRQTASFQRSEDGTASAERNTTVTNKETGITYTGNASWEKGSGASREGSCKDSSGNTVTCGGSR